MASDTFGADFCFEAAFDDLAIPDGYFLLRAVQFLNVAAFANPGTTKTPTNDTMATIFFISLF